MFDNIKCEAFLPITKTMARQFRGVDFNKINYQTKDLENTLSLYIINNKGYLYTEVVHGDWIDNPKPKGHKGRFWLPHKFIEKGRTIEKVKHTGDVYFYDHVADKKGDEYWIEFKATFLKGKLLEISLFEKKLYKTKLEIEEDKQALKILFEKDAKSFRTRSRKFLNKLTFGGYSGFISFIARSFYNLGDFCKKIQIFIYRNF